MRTVRSTAPPSQHPSFWCFVPFCPVTCPGHLEILLVRDTRLGGQGCEKPRGSLLGHRPLLPSQAASPAPAKACSRQSSPPSPGLPSVYIRKGGFDPDPFVYPSPQFPNPERPLLGETVCSEQRTASEAKYFPGKSQHLTHRPTLSDFPPVHQSPLAPGPGLRPGGQRVRKAREGRGWGGGGWSDSARSPRPAAVEVSSQGTGALVEAGPEQEVPRGARIQASPGEDRVGQGGAGGGGVSALSDPLPGPTPSTPPFRALPFSLLQAGLWAGSAAAQPATHPQHTAGQHNPAPGV